MFARKLTLFSVLLSCATWVMAQSVPTGGAAPAGSSATAGQTQAPAQVPGNQTPNTTPPPTGTGTPPTGTVPGSTSPKPATPGSNTQPSTINPNTPNTPGTAPSGSPCGSLPGTPGAPNPGRPARVRRTPVPTQVRPLRVHLIRVQPVRRRRRLREILREILQPQGRPRANLAHPWSRPAEAHRPRAKQITRECLGSLLQRVRFSGSAFFGVPSMFDSLEVQVLFTT